MRRHHLTLIKAETESQPAAPGPEVGNLHLTLEAGAPPDLEVADAHLLTAIVVAARQVEQQAQATPDWPGAEAIKTPQVDADHICRLAMDGDKHSLQILSELFKNLCIGIDTVASLHAPDIITVNGIFNLAEPLLRDAIDQYCHGVRPETVISINPYNDRQGAIGAALLTASRIYNPVHQLPA